MMRTIRTIRGQRGNAMVLAALILLSLTAVGVISIEHTNTDLMASGNQSQASKAALAADMGMNQSEVLLGDQATCYTKVIRSLKREHQTGNLGYTEPDCSNRTQTANPNLSLLMIERSSVSAGDNHLISVANGEALARLQQDMAYDGEIFWISEKSGKSGWQVEGSSGGGASLCFQTYDIKTRGGLPTLGEQVSETLCPVTTGEPCFSDDDCRPGSTCQDDHCYCQPRKVVVQGLSRVKIGPTPCELN